MLTCTAARRRDARLIALVLVAGSPIVARAEELIPERPYAAHQLVNPLAELASITFEHDRRPTAGTLTARALLPVSLDDHWYLVGRAELPLGDRGVENSSASLYIASSDLAWRGVLLGVGPTVSFPASERDLGARATGLGIAAALLYERGPATYGLRTEHVWSLDGDRSELDMEPQVAWSAHDTGTLVTVSCELSLDVSDDAWSIAAIPEVGRVVDIAGVAVALTAGPLVPVAASDWGFRTSIALAP